MNNYKLYQLFSFFILKFSYSPLKINGLKKDELWLINQKSNFYPIIRLTTSSIETVIYEENNIRMIIEGVSRKLKMENNKFLDIHVGNEDIIESIEKFDSISMNTNYYSGIEVNDIFPGIKNCLHDVEDPNFEIASIISEINNAYKNEVKQRKALRNTGLIITISSIVLCVLMYVLTSYLSMNHGMINALVALGANYKTFTVGLFEFPRLLLAGLLHANIMHLAMNMLALYNIGRFLEKEVGSLKYALILYGSVIIASLMSLLFSDNTISVGLSGGIYGLMGVYLMMVYKNGQLSNPAVLQVVFINILINFMGGIDIYGHLGGFISGVIFYLIIFEKKHFISIYLIVLIVLGIKVYTVDRIEPKYLGTDMAVVRIYDSLGFKNHSLKLQEKLKEFYQRF